ncbi:MAG: hypothetical protein CML06_00280 [Pseudomonadales bacterium]|nr:hypothetical protein [Pseudomonadales bacterium]
MILFLGSILLMGFSVFAFKYFSFDSSPYIFFEEGNEHFKRLERMENTYGRDFKVFFMISAQEGDMFTPENLRVVEEVTKKAWTYPYVRRVDSVINFQHIESQDDVVNVDSLVTDEVLENPELLAQRKQIALTNQDVVKRLISEDGKHVAISMALTMEPEETQTPEAMDLVEQMYALKERIKKENPKLDVALVGNLISTYHGTYAIGIDLITLIPLMFVLMFVLLAVLLRSISSIVITFLIAIGCTLGAIGFSSLFGIVFSMIAMNTVIICLTISIAHCIHLFVAFGKALRTKDKAAALRESLMLNFKAVSLTSLMTVIGFLSLNTSDLPPAAALGEFVIRRRYQVLVVTGLLAVIAGALSLNNRLNDRLVETLREPHVFRTDTRLVDQHFGSMYINNYDMDSGEEYGITDPEYLNHLDQFAAFLRAQPEISSVLVFSDIIKQLNQKMNNDDPEYYRIPDNRELVSQYMLLYELSLPMGLDLSERVTPDRSRTLVIATMPTMDTHLNIELDQRINRWQEENLPASMRVGTSSISTIWSYLTLNSLRNSIEGSFVALGLISLVLLFVLRSIRYGLISLVPNMMPAIFGLGFWYLYSGEIGLGLMSVTIITIGIVVDDTVHFLVKYKKSLHDTGSKEEAVRMTFH